MENLINKITVGNFFELVKQIPDKSVDLCVTDPPYEIHADSGGGLHKTRDWLKNVHDSGLDTFEPIPFLEELKRVLKVFNAYIFCSKELFVDYIQWFRSNDYNWDWLVLDKTNPIPTKNFKYLPDREMCFFVREKGAYFNCDIKPFSKYKGVHRINVTASKYHPTEKPLQAISNYIEISSRPGDLVIDPFIGSGTTAVACRNLERKFIGFEINQKHYEMAQRKLSGLPPDVSLADTFFSIEGFE